MWSVPGSARSSIWNRYGRKTSTPPRDACCTSPSTAGRPGCGTASGSSQTLSSIPRGWGSVANLMPWSSTATADDGGPGGCLADSIQLCGQALCLEEMFATSIPEGALFYGTPHRRTVVRFSPELREKTERTVAAVREMLASARLPSAQKSAVCSSCSLAACCMPGSPPAVSVYLDKLCEEEG